MKTLVALGQERAKAIKQLEQEERAKKDYEAHRTQLFEHIAQALVELSLIESLKVADLHPFKLTLKRVRGGDQYDAILAFAGIVITNSTDYVWFDGKTLTLDGVRWKVTYADRETQTHLAFDDALAYAFQIIEDEQITIPNEDDELPF